MESFLVSRRRPYQGLRRGGMSLVYASAIARPGHHAYPDLYGGYCYLNNAAIAADLLAANGRRPAILDIDYHHGNGTQVVFYDRADVFFCCDVKGSGKRVPLLLWICGRGAWGEGEGSTLSMGMLPPANR